MNNREHNLDVMSEFSSRPFLKGVLMELQKHAKYTHGAFELGG
jgi:hypothetical protein